MCTGCSGSCRPGMFLPHHARLHSPAFGPAIRGGAVHTRPTNTCLAAAAHHSHQLNIAFSHGASLSIQPLHEHLWFQHCCLRSKVIGVSHARWLVYQQSSEPSTSSSQEQVCRPQCLCGFFPFPCSFVTSLSEIAAQAMAPGLHEVQQCPFQPQLSISAHSDG